MELIKPRATSAARPVRALKTVTTPYDAAANLDAEERMTALQEAALEDGHPQVIEAALGAIARAQCLAKIAKETGLNPKPIPGTVWRGQH